MEITGQYRAAMSEPPFAPTSEGVTVMGFIAIGAENGPAFELCFEGQRTGEPVVMTFGYSCNNPAELFWLVGAPRAPAKGGLAPWAERRCIELMRERLSEGISLKELAAEVRLSVSHFVRMFKQSVGVPPRTYLTRLRVEKACELLEQTDLPITAVALEVGYSSNQVLARVFVRHRHLSPSAYRRAVRDPVRRTASSAQGGTPTVLETKP